MGKFRLIFILPFTLMVPIKLNIIQVPLEDSIVHYLFNGSILIFSFAFLVPFISLIIVKAYKNEAEQGLCQLLWNIPGSENIEVYTAKKFFSKNAATYYGWKNPVILIGQDICTTFDKEQILFLMYHEYYHIKNNHIMINFISLLFCLVIMPIIVLILSPYILEVSVTFAVICIFCIYLGSFVVHFYFARRRELQCDTFAAHAVGMDVGVRTLHELTTTERSTHSLFSLFSSHPPMDKRIKHIQSI